MVNYSELHNMGNLYTAPIFLILHAPMEFLGKISVYFLWLGIEGDEN
jgi:hypothetical protein